MGCPRRCLRSGEATQAGLSQAAEFSQVRGDPGERTRHEVPVLPTPAQNGTTKPCSCGPSAACRGHKAPRMALLPVPPILAPTQVTHPCFPPAVLKTRTLTRAGTRYHCRELCCPGFENMGLSATRQCSDPLPPHALGSTARGCGAQREGRRGRRAGFPLLLSL